jgi:hypothetical protein
MQLYGNVRKYVKKPVPVRARQVYQKMQVGNQVVEAGDWIVYDQDKEYVITNAEFMATYQREDA